MTAWRWMQIVFHGVPFCVLLIVGGLVALLAELTDWYWLERLELYLRETVERLEATIARI